MTGASSRASDSGTCSPVSSMPVYSGSPTRVARISSPSGPPTTPYCGSSSVVKRAILTTIHLSRHREDAIRALRGTPCPGLSGRPRDGCEDGVVRIETLTEDDWQARRSAHEERVDAWVEPHLARRSRGASHPVEDFLFTYYSYSPASLRRWHPGVHVRLEGAGAAVFAARKGYVPTEGGVVVDTALDARREEAVSWIRRLLGSTAD